MTRMKNMAWLGDPDLKEQVLLKMKQHRVEDSIVQGEYQTYDPKLASQYRGCLLGCTLPMRVSAEKRSVEFHWHEGVRRLYGIPQRLSYLLESLFESLPEEECADFAVESIEAIPVGADLNWVMDRWNEQYEAVADDGDAGCDWRLASEQAKELLTLLRSAPVPEPAQ